MQSLDHELVANVDPGCAWVAGVVEVGGPRVHAQPNHIVLERLDPCRVATAKLVDLVRVELKDIEVVEQQGPDEDLVVGEAVNLGLLGEVAGRLEDLEQGHGHQGPVEDVLRPPLLIQTDHVEECQVGQLVAAHRQRVGVEMVPLAREVLHRVGGHNAESQGGQGGAAQPLDKI